MNEEGRQGLRRREFLTWLCRVGGGATALTLGSGILPLRRVNTTLFGGTAHALEPCADDVCTTRDACETGDPGHTCQVQDVCDVDESGDCTGDRCGEDTSGPCTNDGGPSCPEDETCPEDTCSEDYAGLCENDRSLACTNDACRSDSSGTCADDACIADASDSCANDTCIADSSGGCTENDACTADSSGNCVNDDCSSDSSGDCRQSDTCVTDKSGECQLSDACRSDSSKECNQSDTCISDSSGLCSNDECIADASDSCANDTCVADSSGNCVNDDCSSDSSGDCQQSDTCYSDQSGACASRDRCNSDYSGDCVLDVCVLDASLLCDNDLCREDRSPADCTGKDTCALDLAYHSRVSRRNFARAAINQAIKTLYHMAAVILFLALAYGQSEADTAIDSTDAVFSDTPAYVTAGSVAVPSPAGPFLRDCDGDGILEADTNGDGLCAGDPEVQDYDGNGSRELPEGAAFTGDFHFTCFFIPDDAAIVATGPLTIAASKEAAVFGVMRLPSGIALSCPAMIDLRTSAWLSEDGSEVRFVTTLSGEIDETENYYYEEDSLPATGFTSVCAGLPRITATPASLHFGNVFEGSSSDLDATVANESDTDLIVGMIAQADPLADPFSLIDDNCSGRTLATAETCALTIRFEPPATGAFKDSFDIPSNDPERNPLTVAVQGRSWAVGDFVWEGYTEEWNDPGNWLCGHVPSLADDAYIAGTCPGGMWPEIAGSPDAEANTLFIEGGSLKIQSGKITIGD